MWKKWVEVGETKLNELANQVLSNDALLKGVEDMMKLALGAKAQAVTSIKAALKLMNVPSLEDIERLERKLDEIEDVFKDMQASLDRKNESSDDSIKQPS